MFITTRQAREKTEKQWVEDMFAKKRRAKVEGQKHGVDQMSKILFFSNAMLMFSRAQTVGGV